MLVNRIAAGLGWVAKNRGYAFSVANETSFLEMVREYIDKAGNAAGIPHDRLKFLKSPDYSLKFNIPFLTGTPPLTQTQDSSKLSKPTESSTRPTGCPPREVLVMRAESTSRKWRHWLLLCRLSRTSSQDCPTEVPREASRSTPAVSPKAKLSASPKKARRPQTRHRH
jgi:hypothetical protein